MNRKYIVRHNQFSQLDIMRARHPLSEDLNHILCYTEPLFCELHGKKIFLTGGTGFFGKWLLESFIWANNRLKLNAQMHVLSRNPRAFATKYPHLADAEGIVFHQGDVRTFDFPEERIDFVVHAATDASAQLNQENPLLMMDTIIEGTRRMLEFSRTCGARRFLLTSSGAVYGKQPSDMTHVPEDYPGAPDPIQPASAYGEGKRLAELLCSIHQKKYGTEVVIARCFAFVGPYLPLDRHYAIGNFVKDTLVGRSILISGDGTPYRSYMYAGDLAIWLWTLLFRGESGEAYNVGSEEAISIYQLAQNVQRIAGGNRDVRVCQIPVKGIAPARYIPSTKKAQIELGLGLDISLDEGIRRTIDWHRTGNMQRASLQSSLPTLSD